MAHANENCQNSKEKLFKIEGSYEELLNERNSYEEKIKSLSDELTSFRQSHENEKRKFDETLTTKLEMEAKLSNLNEEKRALIERCISSEEQSKWLKDDAIQLKRRLEEAEAALHELGRENVSLQVEANKIGSRKWADDDTYTNMAKNTNVKVKDVADRVKPDLVVADMHFILPSAIQNCPWINLITPNPNSSLLDERSPPPGCGKIVSCLSEFCLIIFY